MTGAPATEPLQHTQDRVDPHRAAGLVDVLVYVVVLNLFVEYLPSVLSETFTLSLLTAVLLKGILEVVVAVKNRVRARYRRASGPVGKAFAAALLWAVLVGSKFVVLEAVALVFGDQVSLGGFVPVTLLVITLLLARALVRRLLGTGAGAGAGPDAGAGEEARR